MIPYIGLDGAAHPLSQYENFYIQHEQDGFQDTLCFELDPISGEYQLIEEEAHVVYGGNNWLIKKINNDKIECTIDFDFLKEQVFVDYYSDSVSLSTLLQSLLPSGYAIQNANITSIHRTIALDFATPYEVLQKAMSTYGVFFEWKTAENTVTVHSASAMVSSGEYVTDQLNLRSLSFTGETTNFATRLYPYGKDGLTIASVNGGKAYVENRAYCDKVVCAYWSDERYTIAENLKADAEEKLEEMAQPVRAYECDVIDLAKSAPDKYDFLTFLLHRVITLIDRSRGIRVNHKIVQYREYPDEPDRNTVTLSSVVQDISSSIRSAIAAYDDEQRAKGEDDWMNDQIMAVTALLTNATGSHPFTDEDGNLYLADDENLQAAKSVWIFNKNGMGHSSTGVEGPYTTAWTYDSKFIADLVFTMTVRANKVVAGILQDVMGNNRWNLDTGQLHLSSSTTVDGESFEDKYYTKSEVDVTASGITTKITQEIKDRQSAVKTLQSSIEQNASAIRLKVSSSEVESLIEQNADSIRLLASEISWDSRYSSMTEDGVLSCTEAEISGTVMCGSDKGYWTMMNTEGQIEGGYRRETYGYIDFSAESYHELTGEEYHGLQVQGGTLRISCPIIATRSTTNVNASTYIGTTGSFPYVCGIEDNGNGTITWHTYTMEFENGLMVSLPL